MSKILDSIQSPDDLKKLGLKELKVLSDELRDEILVGVSRMGGHLSSNLGVIELTIALLRSIEQPADQVV